MSNISEKAYMTIDSILEHKNILTGELSNKLNELNKSLTDDQSNKLNEIKSLFKNISKSDIKIKEVLDSERHRKIPYLFRKA